MLLGVAAVTVIAPAYLLKSRIERFEAIAELYAEQEQYYIDSAEDLERTAATTLAKGHPLTKSDANLALITQYRARRMQAPSCGLRALEERVPASGEAPWEAALRSRNMWKIFCVHRGQGGKAGQQAESPVGPKRAQKGDISN